MVQYHDGKHLHSDHALLEFTLDRTNMNVSTDLLKMRALILGKSVYETRQIKIEKSLLLSQCNEEGIRTFFSMNNPPM